MDTSKNQGLQVARAIAALTVAYFHSYIALRGFPESAQIPIEGLKKWGFLGVELFFAVSGYVICLVTSRPEFSVRSFVIKRVFRLFPIYWLAMTIVLAMIFDGRYRVEPLGHFLYSMTLLPQQGASAYDVSWTLEREVVFYAIAAITIPIVGARGLAVVLALLAGAGWYFGNPWTFHLVSDVQASFLAGVVVFLFRNHIQHIGAVIPLAIGCGALWLTRSHGFAFDRPICMALILAGMINLRLPWHRWPFRWIVAIGDASYSIYLLHYIVFYWSAVLSKPLRPLPDWLCEPWRVATLAAVCVISWVTWRSIESPMIRFGNLLARRDVIAPAAAVLGR